MVAFSVCGHNVSCHQDVLTLASYFCPEEDQSIWLKRRQGSNPVFLSWYWRTTSSSCFMSPRCLTWLETANSNKKLIVPMIKALSLETIDPQL